MPILSAMFPQGPNLDAAATKAASALSNMNISYAGPRMAQILGDKKLGGQQSLAIIGHRGSGKNKVIISGEAPNTRPSVMENTIKSLVQAGENGADFVEFDVQVTKDGHAVIFHDDHIIIDNKGSYIARRIGDLTLEEYLSLGFQSDGLEIQMPLVRKASDGSICRWIVNVQDCLCTLKDAFEKIPLSVGFNIELKFDDEAEVPQADLQRVISVVLREVEMYGKGRKVFYSSFHPDAVDLVRKMQAEFPVLFLTDGGTYIYKDERRNSIESAIRLCLQCGLQGIVSEVKAILENPGLVSKVKDAGLCLLTYGELNNYVEALQKQKEVNVDGVIVDHVLEIVTATQNDTSLSITSPSSDKMSSRDLPGIVKAAA
ncbi:glycerophosphodiester phosphodiesterase GDPD2 [Cryptomeria japonica]|uniref:glycerophosphodiester phosphodiesterase GDPD2 n=1 Tax=Cryptomeria japonica TaxID=3369 RepID=UPI0025AC6A32|nr:glycerophosphodiester phosphodiesterase GDPD2 [Cryptomeria japonica]